MTLFLSLFACTDVQDDGTLPDHNHEVITRVELELEPVAGGDLIVASWSDSEMDGNPVVEGLSLPIDGDFALTVRFFNELEEPAEELSSEVLEAGEEHQIFFTGDLVGPGTDAEDGLVEHVYADQDSSGLPLGLENTLTVLDIGAGELVVTLRHMPPVGDTPSKEADLAELLSEEGFVALPGDNDVQVSFPLEILGE
ncbi:MAG: hypothetical protein ACI9VR_004626 [Cognaticolwellia sp.]|jgi:hypothetical protein